MTKVNKNNAYLNAHIYKYAAQYSKPLHIVFWVVFFCTLVFLDIQKLDVITNIVSNLTITLFFATIVYVNILYLVPKYLFNQKTLLYIVLLITGILLITPVYISLRIIIYRQYPSLANLYYFNYTTVILIEIFVALASLIYAIIIDWLKKRGEVAALYTTNIETELNFLKTQINPHFLFNSLNSIYAHTLKKSDEAPELVLKLSEIMRYMLYDCNEAVVPLEQEINYIRNYLELEKVRKGKNNEISFTIDGPLDGHNIAPLLLITFVENSFKHGVNNVSEGFVRLKCTVDNHNLNFKIVNSVSPQLHIANLQKKSGGIGLENAKRRLELLYPNRHRLDIKKRIDEFEVNLIINL
ncbi:sensor histidine kinase [Membranihabitans marinus]|uniref:sensor histidine kinase n=1 Tax=Membranihabitans marinus TaxID=1227546 RepID=UPI001F16F2E4|nr:histidine kinase [Membranihabitans marinus]